MKTIKKYAIPIFFFAIFETIAITLWLALDNMFYFFNFTYIGGFLAVGFTLYIKKVKYARRIAQLGVGLYMLLYLGLLCNLVTDRLVTSARTAMLRPLTKVNGKVGLAGFTSVKVMVTIS